MAHAVHIKAPCNAGLRLYGESRGQRMENRGPKDGDGELGAGRRLPYSKRFFGKSARVVTFHPHIIHHRRSMKEALVSPDLSVKVVDSPVPAPGQAELLIKVFCAGCNPKDWKWPSFANITANSGDDIAGEVVSCGEGVVGFRAGDRVAAFHQMRTAGGAFAEFAVAPAATTFHLPDHITFAEAATIPLAALTAAIALYHNLGLPLPWQQAQGKIPLLIYGGSTAIGTFAIKLAGQSKIHPLLVIAGKGRAVVEPLLDVALGDAIIDYRDGLDATIKTIQSKLEAAGSGSALHAFDAISETVSFGTLSRVLDPHGHITLVRPEGDYTSIPPSLTTSLTFVGIAHEDPPPMAALKGIRWAAKGDGKDFAYVFCSLFSRGLQAGWLRGHPHEIFQHGLGGLASALQSLQRGEASGVKYVLRLEIDGRE
ncbi:hypothetical protein LTR53_010018 [Teratosphaeriaceae sp. CCFEE 6253]|nr:hypothetical protein LTR53_010018 [Teratosphaeriaceae sp. CCFEE 6253]